MQNSKIIERQNIIRDLRNKFQTTSYNHTKDPNSIQKRDFGLCLANGLEAELEGNNKDAYIYYSKSIELNEINSLARHFRLDFILNFIESKANSTNILSFDQIMEDCKWQVENKEEPNPKKFHEYQFLLLFKYYFTYRENSKGADYNSILQSLEQKKAFEISDGQDGADKFYCIFTFAVINIWSYYIPRKVAINKFNSVNVSILNYLSKTPNDIEILDQRYKLLVSLFAKTYHFDNNIQALNIIINLAKARLKNDVKDEESYNEYALYLLMILGLGIHERQREIITLVSEFCYRTNEINPKSINNLIYRADLSIYYGMCLDTENIDKYINQANDLYLKAESIDSKNPKLYSIWAYSISRYAKEAPIKKKPELYASAFGKYRKATILEPGCCQNYFNWANSIIQFALTADDDLRQRYFYDASQKYLMAIELGRPQYGLSRAYALMKEEDKALSLLNTRLKDEEILPKHVIKDPAWKNYLDNPKFKVILDKYSE